MQQLAKYTVGWLLWALPLGVLADEREAFFEAKIRPLLVAHCLDCHGAENPEADLQLTSRDGILRGGQSGPAAVPGDPTSSRLLTAVEYETALQMPPDGRLSDAEIADLRTWIADGLVWPAAIPANTGPEPMRVTAADREHWSFRPIAAPSTPSVSSSAWVRRGLDAFVLAKLESLQLKPAPPADRPTLLRRLYYDLIGLPPTYEDVQRFVTDDSADALERVVEQLLASPRYGERWGRHWLDVARYADTKDGVLMYGDARLRPYAYSYRDYVIRAFNQDLRFDQFVHQQVAADLIEPPVEPWQLAALGFLTLGRQYDNNIHDVIDDQIDTISRGLMGLTVSCARCHDHKYDPIPTADYYALYGVLASSEVPGELPVIPQEQPPADQEEVECTLYGKRFELKRFVAAEHAKQSAIARERTGDYLQKIATQPVDPIESTIFFLSLAPEDLRPAITIRWRRLLRERAVPDDPVFGLWHDLMQLEQFAEGAPDDKFAASASTVLDQAASRPAGCAPGECNPLVLAGLREQPLRNRGDVAQAYGRLLLANFSAVAPHPEAASPAQRQLFDLLASSSSPCFIPLSQTHRYTSRAETDQYWGKISELDLIAATSPSAAPRAMVVAEKPEPFDPRIFVRGNPTQLGSPVPRRFVSIARPGEPQPFEQGSGRLELAHAITAVDNPLTARVIVNRVWMYHFGEPLVRSPSDFGRRSEPPSHPELLDYLATYLRDQDWSLKQLHREIVLSSAYQMASRADPADSAKSISRDPENRYLWRMNRQRLDFESLRDTLLAVAGVLQQQIGGRPIDVAANPQATCRTVYGLVDRQSLPAVFRAFDFASPDQSNERRSRTMMPQQALFALNSPLAVEMARSVVRRPEVANFSDSAERVRALFRVILAREPNPAEFAEGLEFAGQPPDGGSSLSSWEQLAQVLLCSNELMYVD